jgi:trehalose 6-phosphate phosphatase
MQSIAEVERPDRVALFLDVDGTLLDIAALPTSVIVPPSLIRSLSQAEKRLGGALALVSGRSVDDLDRLFDPLHLRASGVHGAQMRFEPGDPIRAAGDAQPLPRSLWDALIGLLEQFEGTIVENKRFSFAVHYRMAPRLGPRLRDALELLIAGFTPRIEIIDAHYAFELKSKGFDKGLAIERFLARPPFSGRAPIFIGDDTTDEAGFAAVVALGGAAYSVGTQRPGVSGVFSQPETVRTWLAEFANQGALS